MGNERMNDRVTLYDVKKSVIKIKGREFHLSIDENEVGRGGPCLVIHARESVFDAEGKMLKRKVLLKEFYPEL